MRPIDADALIPMMRYATIDNESGVFPIKIGFDAIVKVINAQPNIEPKPERKNGKWERRYSRPNVYEDLCWHCSVCEFKTSDNWANKWNFCPNCGADMRGEE